MSIEKLIDYKELYSKRTSIMKEPLPVFFLSIVLMILACSNKKKIPEEQAAMKYCGSCHMYPEPSLLDKRTWTESILPKMSSKLGIRLYEGKYAATLTTSTPGTSTPSVSFNDWMKIVEFYSEKAPEEMPLQNRQKLNNFTNLFKVKEPDLKEPEPSYVYIKIDGGNRSVYAGSAYDSTFSVFDSNLRLVDKHKIGIITVHLDFNEPLNLPGQRTGLLTNIGGFYPTNERIGTIHSFNISAGRKFTLSPSLADHLPRPVQTTGFAGKKSQDSLIICGFGHESGALYYLHRNPGETQYKKKILSRLPGAIRVVIEDYDRDGLPDILALFSQESEGIYLFTNKGNGNFQVKELLLFPPVYGSTYFEMQDVNGDGLKDIIYTCGDNYDYSRVLKNYHGVYIFINDAGKGFKQEYFFPINGCYKAVGRDFDMDGDIDIAAISFFPDVKNQPQESFVYLSNTGNLTFFPSGIRQFNSGNWISMDAADADGDGDEDIVIGSFILRNSRAGDHAATHVKVPPFLFLINQTR